MQWTGQLSPVTPYQTTSVKQELLKTAGFPLRQTNSANIVTHTPYLLKCHYTRRGGATVTKTAVLSSTATVNAPRTISQMYPDYTTVGGVGWY